MATTKRLDITDWTTAVDTEQSDDITDLDVESLTITELKDILRCGFDRNKEAADRVHGVSSSTDAANSMLGASGSLAKASTPSSAATPTSVPSTSNDYQQHLEEYEAELEEVGTTTLDKEFKEELDCIRGWFDVLFKEERTATMHTLLRKTATLTQARFYTFALNQITKTDMGLHFLSLVMDGRNRAKLRRLEAAMAKLIRETSSVSGRPAGGTWI